MEMEKKTKIVRAKQAIFSQSSLFPIEINGDDNGTECQLIANLETFLFEFDSIYICVL